MLFVTIFLVILSITFIGIGVRFSKRDMTRIGLIFLISALGTGMITFFALSVLKG